MLIKHHEPVLRPQMQYKWADGAVFNPGCWYDGERVHMLFRAISSGYSKVKIDNPRENEMGFGYDEQYISVIGHASSTDGVTFMVSPEPLIRNDQPFNRWGVEDPRITRIGDRYWITHTALHRPAFDEVGGVRIGLASTADFSTVRHHGLIGPDVTDKDAVIFPKPIHGKIMMLHRINPSIQLAVFDGMEELIRPPKGYWERHLERLDEHVLLKPEYDWESRKIGAGPPPIETPLGWLLIYHGVDEHHVYRMGAALLDLDDPMHVIARSRIPLLEPVLPFEKVGDVPNVIFPQGAFVKEGVLMIYYGAADTCIGLATVQLQDLLEHLLSEERQTRNPISSKALDVT